MCVCVCGSVSQLEREGVDQTCEGSCVSWRTGDGRGGLGSVTHVQAVMWDSQVTRLKTGLRLSVVDTCTVVLGRPPH